MGKRNHRVREENKMLDLLSHGLIISFVIVVLLLSIICQIIIGVLFQKLIKEADNMATTENRRLKQCKLKFSNCAQLHSGVQNIPIFIDKFINRIKYLGFTLSGISHLAGQLMLAAVFSAGIGICKGIIEGETLGSLLPYYIISLFGLYCYFSISSLVDLQGKKIILKTNLIDYFENHILKRTVEVNQVAQEREKVPENNKEKELEELLREFLA